MICPNCQTPNREIARFCKACGRLLVDTCPHCGSQLPGDASFCDICGQPLRVAAVPVVFHQSPALPSIQERAPAQSPARSGLHQYIPEELLAKLQAAQETGGMVGERRVVTMLFCDVKGSTAAAEQLDPEEWSDIINGAFEHMIAPVYRYEGTVARLMGDGILAFFGAPIAHEDDAVRAVMAGLEIVAGAENYGVSVRQRYGIEILVRVGINTGRVVVGAVGSDLRLEYTALGDAINVASRMESSAEPGTVRIAHDTYRLVAPFFDVADLGGVTVKGKKEPVPSYRVLRRKVDAERPHGIAGLESPLVGRASEMAYLGNALNDLRQGHGRIVFLIGQAGLGKSRLVRELRALAAGDENGRQPLQFWMQRPVASYQAAEAYGVLRDQIRQLFAIGDDVSPAGIQAALQEGVAEPLADGQPEHYEPLARLMGVSADGEGGRQGHGELFKRQLFAAVLALIRGRIGRDPSILVIDDLQWVDPASVEVLQHLFQLVDSTPVLFLCASRPDRTSPGWELRTEAEKGFHHRFQEIQLAPLAEEHSMAMLDGLIPGIQWPVKLRSLILEKSEGNPFFIEEVVRTLVDNGIVSREPAGGNWRVTAEEIDFVIPGNLQALLAARFDRLPEEDRRVLQLAAVIGRSFDIRVLGHVCEDPADLDRSLAALQRAELIVETATIPVRLFRFRNTLAQETVYRSILRKTRREWHGRVGEALLAIYADRLEEQLPALAYHFYQAEDPRAIAYNSQAGDAASRLYANSEAATYYDRAIEMAREDRDSPAGQLASLYKRRGRALELASRFADALANYHEMETLAVERRDKTMELASLLLSGTLYSTANDQHDAAKAQAVADRALSLAGELQDEASEAKIYWNLLNMYRLSDSFIKARPAGERSLALARKNHLTEQLAFTANDLTHVYYSVGLFEEAGATINEAIALWRELDNQPMLADSLATASYVIGMSKDIETAIALADESYEISRAIDNLWGQSYSRFYIGQIYWYLGKVGKAIEVMEECVRLGKQAGFLPGQLYIGSYLALNYAFLGDYDTSVDRGRQILDQTRREMRLYEPAALGNFCQILLLAGRPDEAESVFTDLIAIKLMPRSLLEVPVAEAKCHYKLSVGDFELAVENAHYLVELAEELNATIFQPSAYQLLGEAFLRAGKLDLAGEALEKARAIAEELHLHWPLWQILATSAELQLKLGHIEEAKLLQLDARLAVNEIAEQIPSADLRASFLARQNWPAY